MIAEESWDPPLKFIITVNEDGSGGGCYLEQNRAQFEAWERECPVWVLGYFYAATSDEAREIHDFWMEHFPDNDPRYTY